MTHGSDCVRYYFRDAVGGYFELPTEDARVLLPRGAEPVEPRHGSAALAVLAFDFVDTPVGPFGELVLSILAAPYVDLDMPWPRSAFYPLWIGTTTRASREHGTALWRLPHHSETISLDWHVAPEEVVFRASGGEAIAVEGTVTGGDATTAEHSYQAFAVDGGELYRAHITMCGEFSETDEERGRFTIHHRRLHELLGGLDLGERPFLETRMRDGVQTVYPLKRITKRTDS